MTVRKVYGIKISSRHHIKSKQLNLTTDVAEFRQQIAALRRLGGSEWLILLNQLQKKSQINTPNFYTELDHSGKSKCNCRLLISTFDENWSEDLPKDEEELQQYLYSNYFLIPNWLNKLDISNSKFIENLKTILFNESTKYLCNHTINFISWIIMMSRSKNIPSCLVLTSHSILLMKIKSISKVILIGGKRQEKWPVVSHLLTILPSEILSVVIGPCNAYIEIQVGSVGGVQVYTLMTSGQELVNMFVNKLSIFDIKTKKKYASLEFETAVAHGLQLFPLNENETMKDMLYCHRILKLHCSGHENAIHYLALTQSHLLTVEELTNMCSICDLKATFHICAAINIRTNITRVLMKDHGSSQVIFGERSDNSEDLLELYTCGFWLLIDFETQDLFHMRFLNQRERNNFLEVFMNIRSS